MDASADTFAIELRNLTKFFGSNPAVTEANLTVEQGAFFGFVGPNGSGKSTTIRLMMNYLRPTSGQALLFGKDAAKYSAAIKRDVGFVPSEMDYCLEMKAGEAIRYAASLRRCKDWDWMRHLCELFELETGRKIRKMSLGNRKKVSLVIALMSRPKLLILDEPTVGLDSLVKKRFQDLLREENQRGVTVFFCSHDMDEVQSLCNKVAIIRRGSILEVEDVSALSAADCRRISVKTQEDLGPLLELLQAENVRRMDDSWHFLYRGEINVLVQALANYSLEDLQIGRPSLEDAILRYYGKKMEKEESELG